MIPSLVIFARESLEATMILAIVMAYLHRTGNAAQIRSAWWGVGLALLADAVLGTVIYFTIHSYNGTRIQTLFEGSMYFIAVIILTTMSFWMKRESRGMRRHLESGLGRALNQSSKWSVLLVSGVTVGREGLETMVFMLALGFQSRPGWLWLGALVGLLLGLLISYAVFRLGQSLSLGVFFNVMGILLLIFAAGLLANGIENFQGLGWLSFGQAAIWHSSRVLSENSVLGDILHSFFGYADKPSVLQAAGWLAFLFTSLWGYLRLGARSSTSAA